MSQNLNDEPRSANDSRARRPVEPRRTETAESDPGLGQKWNKAQPSKRLLFWVILATVILTIAVGFMWGGWVTGGSSLKAGVLVGQGAVIDRLAPICVAQFNEDPDNAVKLEELRELSSYQQWQYVQEQGWATMPGEEEPDRKVAEACADLLLESTP